MTDAFVASPGPVTVASSRRGRPRWFWARLTLACLVASLVLGGGAHVLVRAAGTEIDIPALNESSGLVASQRNPGLLWSHNDSGTPATLYAFSGDGRPVATLTLPGFDMQDWEDLSIGPGADGQPFGALYVGDIGDNGASREAVRVFRVAEPDLTGVAPGDPVALTAAPGTVEELVLTYEDGARDAESLLVDPRDGSVYVATKTTAETARLYRAEFAPPGQTGMLRFEGDVAIPGLIGVTRLLTGGSVSHDATRVVLRTYVGAWWWPVAPGQSITDALTAVPERSALPVMRQGEAVAFSDDGATLYVTSEGSPALLGSVDAPGTPIGDV